jgi:Family of unknown function (DUF6263)
MVRLGSGLLTPVLLAATLTACGSASPSDRQAAATDKRNSVELLSTGSGKKAPILLTVKSGASEKLTMYMDMSARSGSGTVNIPTVAVDMSVDVGHVGDDEITSSFRYGAVKVDGTGPVAAQMRQQMGALSGIHGEIRTDRHGAVQKSDFNIPDGLGTTVSSLLDSLRSQMQNMTVAYPAEPLGVGARWSVHHHVTLAGVTSDVSYTYELVKRTGDQVVLGYTADQTAPEQDPKLPGMPPGATAHLDSQKSSGTGRMTVELGLPLATDVRTSMTTDVAMTLHAEGQSQSIKQHMEMKMRMVEN